MYKVEDNVDRVLASHDMINLILDFYKGVPQQIVWQLIPFSFLYREKKIEKFLPLLHLYASPSLLFKMPNFLWKIPLKGKIYKYNT